jgi:hypothetical protein
MAQTNSGPTAGISHSSTCHGFSLFFFESLAHRLIRDLLDQPDSDQAAGQHLHRPALPALGRRAAGQGDEERLPPRIELRLGPGAWPLVECSIEASTREALPGALYRGEVYVQGSRYRMVRETFAGQEQSVGAADHLSRSRALAREHAQADPILFTEIDSMHLRAHDLLRVQRGGSVLHSPRLQNGAPVVMLGALGSRGPLGANETDRLMH